VRVTLTDKLVASRTPERSAFTLTASFFDDTADTWTASTPTTADYRIDRVRSGDPSCYDEVRAWTTLTPATSIAIAITATDNVISDDDSREERRQVTVRANAGLATQYQGTKLYSVANVAGQL
jgi:hypothetical protein